jgi:hypothetical protein
MLVLIQELRAALLRTPPREGRWQPIKTAPMDGTRVLIWVESPATGNRSVYLAWWAIPFESAPDELGWWETGLYGSSHPVVPQFTHGWMPMPQPSSDDAFPPATPPREAQEGDKLPRYGVEWTGPKTPIAVPMPDGYWTPWHLVERKLETLRHERDEARAYAIRLQDAVDMLDAQLSEARMQAEGAGMHADMILQEAAERVGAAEAKLAEAITLGERWERMWAASEAKLAALAPREAQEVEARHDAAINEIWEDVLRCVQQAWPDDPHSYGNCPTELIAELIDERDGLRGALSTRTEQRNAAEAKLAALDLSPLTALVQTIPAVVKRAEDATGKLRDAAREGLMIHFRQRDELVMDVHAAFELLEQLAAALATIQSRRESE